MILSTIVILGADKEKHPCFPCNCPSFFWKWKRQGLEVRVLFATHFCPNCVSFADLFPLSGWGPENAALLKMQKCCDFWKFSTTSAEKLAVLYFAIWENPGGWGFQTVPDMNPVWGPDVYWDGQKAWPHSWVSEEVALRLRNSATRTWSSEIQKKTHTHTHTHPTHPNKHKFLHGARLEKLQNISSTGHEWKNCKITQVQGSGTRSPEPKHTHKLLHPTGHDWKTAKYI